MIFFTEGAVDAIAFGFLVVTVVDKLTAISNALDGLLIIFSTRFFANFDTPLKKSCNPSDTMELIETVLVLDLLHKLQTPLNNFIHSLVSSIESYIWLDINCG